MSLNDSNINLFPGKSMSMEELSKIVKIYEILAKYPISPGISELRSTGLFISFEDYTAIRFIQKGDKDHTDK